MFTPIHSVYSGYFVPRSGYSEENQESNESQTCILRISQPTIVTPPETHTLPLVGSLEGSPSVSEGTQGDSVYSFIHGNRDERSRNTHPVPIFQTICESGESTPVSTPLVGVGYTNGSQSGYYRAQNETIHLSQLLGGREVIGIYNREGIGSSFFFRRSQQGMTPICEAILDVWDSFFASHPPGSTFIHYFFGNGARYVQEAIRNTKHADNIVLVGICPSDYVEHTRSFYYRVWGDVFSCLDYRGFLRSRVVTLPYSSGSLGITWIHFTDPAFNNAIVATFMQIAGVSAVSQNLVQGDRVEITEISPLGGSNPSDQERNSGIIGHNIQGVIVSRTSSPNVFSRIQTLLGMADTVIQVEESVLPPESLLDRLGEVALNILRISDALSIFWLIPIETEEDGLVLAISTVFFGMDGLCSCFLMLTSPRSRRERYRNVRILFLCYRVFFPLGNLLDLLNNIRMASRDTITECESALYGVITLLGWTLLGRDILEYALPGLRDTLCRRCLRWFGDSTEDQRHLSSRITRIGRENVHRYYRMTSIVSTAVYGIFFALIGGMATFGGLEISESCRYNETSNTTDEIIPDDHTTVWEGFTNGRAYAISQATHMVFSFLATIIYIASLVRMLRTRNR
ncbi:DUF687 domain-containing protein [Chlamydia psittaci]|uniref:DUF687 domain-containing protein n=1 Tax=Chlamydia psittaci TaxID=83554 RepID=UPI00131F52C0|nr:DUF687 domain-containing protein [Chlamydia psittaci]QHE18743.1 DUF687 domain-containing protein [Chlamydia psittaci]